MQGDWIIHYCMHSTHLLCKTGQEFLVKSDIVNLQPSNPTFRYLPEKWNCVHTKLCIQLLIAALSTITKQETTQITLNWGMGTPAVVQLHIGTLLSNEKQNEALTDAVTWRTLECSLLSKRNQTHDAS